MDQISEGGRSIHEIDKIRKRLEAEKMELEAALSEAEGALEQEENKVLRSQLELTQVKKEIEQRIHQKEEEFASTKKNFGKALEGEFWRILLPGIYTMEVFAEGFAPREVQFAIVEQNPTMLNVTLYQDTPRRDGNANPEEVEAPSGLFSFNPLSGLQESASNLLAKLPLIG